MRWFKKLFGRAERPLGYYERKFVRRELEAMAEALPPEAQLILMLTAAKATPVDDESLAQLFARLWLHLRLRGSILNRLHEMPKRIYVTVRPGMLETLPGPYPNLMREWLASNVFMHVIEG